MPTSAVIDPEFLAALAPRARATIRGEIAEEGARAEALREAVAPSVERAVAEAEGRGACRRVWLFGSSAWGQPGVRSAVGLPIEGAGIAERTALVERGRGRMVHAVDFSRAPEGLGARRGGCGKALGLSC